MIYVILYLWKVSKSFKYMFWQGIDTLKTKPLQFFIFGMKTTMEGRIQWQNRTMLLFPFTQT